MNRLRRGYTRWVNPFNRESEYVSFSESRVIIFWSKNPKPLIPFLSEIDDRGINYYFQFTVNDYEQERLEPDVAPLAQRVETFRQLSERVGKKRVIWRFDPLILTDDLTVDRLVDRVARVAEQIKSFTERLVISFADIAVYTKVRNNLAREHVSYHEFTPELMIEVAKRLQPLNRAWGLKIATCAEAVALEPYGIEHNRCIDDRLMIDVFRQDRKLMDFLGYEADLFADPSRPYLKDKGQRKECGCIVSKDIGMYDTCRHLCVYCYANTSCKAVENNLRRHRDDSDAIVS
jgi:DNA repair photolyase